VVDLCNLYHVKKVWVGQHGYFIDALFTALKKRHVDVSAIGKVKNGLLRRRGFMIKTK
tara:strand:+ start:237 stop:410 length:174 start_codon:yes stop_codon:yes gene_type:complete